MVLHVVVLFFNDTATTEIYTLSLHDALPISEPHWIVPADKQHEFIEELTMTLAHLQLQLIPRLAQPLALCQVFGAQVDRKSTRLNSSHANISYAVFCLKKKHKRHEHSQQFTQ